MIDRLDILSDRWRDKVAEAVDWLMAKGFAGRVGLILAKYAVYGVVPAILPSVFLDVPNRLAKRCPTDVSHRKKRNLIVEIHHTLDDHLPLPRASPLLRIAPRMIHVLLGPHRER